VFAQAIRPPTVPEGSSRLRLAVMSSHTGSELREAARTLAAAVPASARRPAPAPEPVEVAGEARIFDRLADAA
jgi:glycine C-acetyltransferase/8-amino-7-oxononanoate synthase